MIHSRTIGFLRHFMRAYPLRTAVMVVLLTLAGLLEGVGVVTLLPLLELIMEADSSVEESRVGAVLTSALAFVGLRPTLGVLLGLIVLAMAAKAAFLWLAMRQVGFTVAQVTTDLRMNLLRALMRARWRYFSSRPAGGLANAISSEAHRSALAYQSACVLMAGVLQMGAYLVVAVIISWQVALIAGLSGAVLLYGLRSLMSMARSAGDDQTQLLRSLIERLTDALRGIKPIRAMGREGHLQPLLERETESLNDALRRQVTASETLRVFHEPVLTAILGAGLFFALTYTDFPFASLIVLAFVFHRLMANLNNIQVQYQSVAVGESAFWSLVEQVDVAQAEEEPDLGVDAPPDLVDGIHLSDVHFSYNEETPVLAGLTLDIPTGAFVALYGPSGVGKTTAADLVIGLHEPDGGRVEVDGVPLSRISLAQWRHQIGYVPQEVLLFNDTVIRNVTLGDESLSDEDVEQALKLADAWDFVRRRPGGLKAMIGEGGAQLSGGQRQRIAIARALVHRPKLLILDEATAALDPKTEREILETLQRLSGEVTILAISHQPALRGIADLVYHLRGGAVEEVEVKDTGGVSEDAGLSLPAGPRS